MSDLEQEALRFKSWASDCGILSYDVADDDHVDHDQLDEFASTPENQTVVDILRHRKINMVGINSQDNKIVVFTHRKITQKELEELPKDGDGDGSIGYTYVKAHPPKVKEPTAGSIGVAGPLLHNGRYTCGSSISLGNSVSAGTLGCLVRDQEGKLYGLTNNHVSGECGYADPAFPVVAPGLLDVRAEGLDPFTLGHHAKISPWISGTPENADVSGNLDAAIFEIKDEQQVSSMQNSYFDTPSTVQNPVENIIVEKVGRTTGHTVGKVVARSVGFEPVHMAISKFKGNIYFTDLLLVQGQNGAQFSGPGDSGSLVCCRQPNGDTGAVGLVFAGNQDQSLSFVLPIQRVLDHFGVQLVSGHNT